MSSSARQPEMAAIPSQAQAQAQAQAESDLRVDSESHSHSESRSVAGHPESSGSTPSCSQAQLQLHLGSQTQAQTHPNLGAAGQGQSSATQSQPQAQAQALASAHPGGTGTGAGSGGGGGGSAGRALPDALAGWTFHQSYDQATVLFLVPRSVRKEDLDVRIGDDYIIAGVRGQEASIKARLHGQVNRSTSGWQLERSERSSRRRHRHGHHHHHHHHLQHQSEVGGVGGCATAISRPASPASSGASSFDVLPSPDHYSSSGSDGGGPGSENSRTDTFNSPNFVSPPITSPPLARSVTLSEDSMRSAMRASTSGGSGTGSGSGSGSGSGLGSGSGEGTGGVQSLHSSMSADASSGSQPSSQQSGGPSPARLVTIHLDKLDSGIWPNLVSGPAPTDPDPDPDVESSLIAALGEALGCPTSPPYSPSITFAGASEGAGVDAGASTLSVNTVNTTTSDDSDTVLGTRGRQRRRRESEARYNMDPTSLSLLGMQITAHHQAGALPGILGSAVGPEKEEAFEYFVRAWRAADIPLATRKLVNDYLPLPAPPAKSPTPAIAEHRSAPAMSTQGSADTFRASTSSSSTVGASSESSTITPIAHDERETSPHRQRLVARLGGPTALARLYVSFARLHFASSEMLRSPLAFPSGQLNNPFATGGPYFSPSPSRASSVASSSSKAQPASPRGVAAMPSPDAAGGAGASGAGMHGNPDPPTALAYLEEARRIDPNVWIEQHEWDEALELAEDALLEAETRREEARAAGAPAPSVDSVSGSGSGSILVPGAEQERKRGRRTRKMAGKGGESMTASGLSYSFTRSGKNGRSGHFGRARGQNHEEGGMIAVVSGAALISFALAGGVAAIGWWRRGQAATG